MKWEYKIALILFGCAVLFRLLFAIPGMQNPELLMRQSLSPIIRSPFP